MASTRIVICVLALLLAEWPGPARATRQLAVKRGRPVSLDPEPAVWLPIRRTPFPKFEHQPRSRHAASLRIPQNVCGALLGAASIVQCSPPPREPSPLTNSATLYGTLVRLGVCASDAAGERFADTTDH